MTVTMNYVTSYTALVPAYSYCTNDTDYSCNIKAIELI